MPAPCTRLYKVFGGGGAPPPPPPARQMPLTDRAPLGTWTPRKLRSTPSGLHCSSGGGSLHHSNSTEGPKQHCMIHSCNLGEASNIAKQAAGPKTCPKYVGRPQLDDSRRWRLSLGMWVADGK